MALKRRQKDILVALVALDEEASTREIAAKTGLHVNGVAQSLGVLWAKGYVKGLGGKAGDHRWKFLKHLK